MAEVFNESTLLFVAVIFAFCLVIGSFLNVVIHRLPIMMGLAALLASLSGLIGLYLSYYLSIASGAAIVLTATAFFLLTFIGKRLRS